MAANLAMQNSVYRAISGKLGVFDCRLSGLGAVGSPYAPREYTFPYVMQPATPLLAKYSGAIVKCTLDQYLQTARAILTEWYEYSKNITARYNEYDQQISYIEQFYIHVRETVASLTTWVYAIPGTIPQAENWNNFYADYIQYMNELNRGRAGVRDAYLRNQNAQIVCEQAKSFYESLVRAASENLAVMDAYNLDAYYRARQAQHEKENQEWEQTQITLAAAMNDPVVKACFEAISLLRRNYFNDIMPAMATRIRELTDAIARQEGKTYGDVAVSTVMKTGYYTKQQVEYQRLTRAQIDEACAMMESYMIELREALKYKDLDKKREVYERIVPQVKGYIVSTSLVVRENALFRAKQSEFIRIVTEIQKQLGAFKDDESNIGLILGIAGAAAGAYMMLS